MISCAPGGATSGAARSRANPETTLGVDVMTIFWYPLVICYIADIAIENGHL